MQRGFFCRDSLKLKPTSPPFSPFWLALWAFALALSWLLPNHHQPWPNFQSDAWASVVFLMAFFAVLLRGESPVGWSRSEWLVLALLPLPMLQHFFGILPFIGEAWVATAYLLGLLLALHAGARWETLAPGQALDALALAIGLAGVASVAIQLIQWLDLGDVWFNSSSIGWRVWIVESGSARPHANLAQPNLLGTLLLWSVLSVAWGVHRKFFGAAVGVMLALFLLFGLALTQSRTAWLGLAMVVALTCYRSQRWGPRSILVVVGLLGLYFAATTLWLLTDQSLASDHSTSDFVSSRVEFGLRPAAWRLFLDAALANPWFGYGWNQVMMAQLAVAENHPSLNGIFGHAHNLFLDLILWFGFPVGLTVSGLILFWTIDKFRRIQDTEGAIAMLFLVVVGIHAMLELPLHYACFLFPAAIVAGTLEARYAKMIVVRNGRAPLLVLGVMAALLLGLIVRDYVGRIEQNFLAMRFEQARIGKAEKAEAPDVIVLTHLREWLRLARFDAHGGMSAQEIQSMSDVAQRNPALAILYKMAWTLAENDRPQEASLWLLKIRQVVTPTQWKDVELVWSTGARLNPKMAAVQFPPPN